MLSEARSTSLIERARSAKDGVLLQRVIDLERARLREHGSKDGLDKFKASSIKLFKNSSDFAGFKKDCVAAFQHFHSGLECLNLLAHFNKKEYGIDPDNDVLLRMTSGFDSNMATRTQIALGRKIDALLDKYESGRDRPDLLHGSRDACMFGAVLAPDLHSTQHNRIWSGIPRTKRND